MKSALDFLEDVRTHLPEDVDMGLVLNTIGDVVLDIAKREFKFTEIPNYDSCTPADYPCGTIFYEGSIRRRGGDLCAAATVPVVVVLPSRGECHVPDELYNVWLEVVRYGVLERLYSNFSKPYADANAARWYGDLFVTHFNRMIHHHIIMEKR